MTPHQLASRRPWSTSQSAADRQLVVLMHNGGVDLGIPQLVDRIIRAVPQGDRIVPDAVRARFVSTIEEGIKSATDTLIESADLALNRFGSAKPDLYSDVTVLRDSTATLAELRSTLFAATRAGRLADVMILTHGNDGIYVDAGGVVGAAAIRGLATEFGSPLAIRSVYMMNCVGSSLNGAWLDAGARTSVGSHGFNYLPEPTLHYFWSKWKAGETFESAATGAYRDTIATINGLIRGFISGLGLPLSLLASQVDAAGWDFVQESRPEVVGAGGLTISSDTLPAPAGDTSGQQSLLVTTVVPSPRAGTAGRAATLSTSLSTTYAVTPAGRAFVTSWERPYLAEGDAGEAELARRIAAAEDFLSLKVGTPLAPSQVDALVSFACGIGAHAFTQSRVLALVQSGDLAGVPAEMLRWIRIRTAQGVVDSAALTDRRRAESELFSGAVSLAVPASREVREYAFQQNPLAALTAAEAIQVGLGAASLVQSQVNAIPMGSLAVAYDTQQRLLTPEAKLQMPGADAPRMNYKRDIIRLPQVRAGTAYAMITIRWEGNAYGEMSTPIVEVDPDRSSGWSRSEASISIRAVSRITPRTDPRTWPMVYHYEGRFDPIGNGDWTFFGDFELNAFGAIRFTNHRVADRSLFGDAWGDDSFHGPDVAADVPTIPDDQMAYLRAHVPG